MPAFAYSARDGGGSLRQGVLEGASAAAVADQLIGGGNTPLAIQPAAAGAAAVAVAPAFSWRRAKTVTHEDLLLFSRQLHSLLKAGIPITRALSGLQESAGEALAATIRLVRESLEGGNELSTSLARQHRVFSNF